MKLFLFGCWVGSLTISILGAASVQAMGRSPLPPTLGEFHELDCAGKAILPQMNGQMNSSKWTHLREFKASPCERCTIQNVRYQETVTFQASPDDLRFQSVADRTWGHVEGDFYTGNEIAHLSRIAQRELPDGAVQFLYEASTEPYIYERGPVRLIQWALVQPEFFTIDPNYDAIRDLQWKLYYAKTPWEEVVPLQFLVLEYKPEQPSKLRIMGYRNAQSEPLIRNFIR